jgi:hypothetical protein
MENMLQPQNLEQICKEDRIQQLNIRQIVKHLTVWIKANFFGVVMIAGLLLLLRNIIFVSCQL